MLRGNLATRPFYNDRLVSALIAGVAVVAVALAAFNAWRLVALVAEREDMRARQAGIQQEIERVLAETAAARSRVDRPTLTRLVAATREANGLIDARAFSWTTLFGVLERTLPLDVRLTAVTPRAEKGVTKVALNIVARDFDALDAFIEALSDTGLFYDVAASEQRRDDDGQYGAIIDASYLPPVLVPAEAAPPAGVTESRQ